jgi:hypothetical protein
MNMYDFTLCFFVLFSEKKTLPSEEHIPAGNESHNPQHNNAAKP